MHLLVSSACNSDGFVKQVTGTCPAGTGFIETDADCAAAAMSLGLSNTIVAVWGPHSVDHLALPHGCYYKENSADSELWRNPSGHRNDEDTERLSLCSCTPGLVETDVDWVVSVGNGAHGIAGGQGAAGLLVASTWLGQNGGAGIQLDAPGCTVGHRAGRVVILGNSEDGISASPTAANLSIVNTWIGFEAAVGICGNGENGIRVSAPGCTVGDPEGDVSALVLVADAASPGLEGT